MNSRCSCTSASGFVMLTSGVKGPARTYPRRSSSRRYPPSPRTGPSAKRSSRPFTATPFSASVPGRAPLGPPSSSRRLRRSALRDRHLPELADVRHALGDGRVEQRPALLSRGQGGTPLDAGPGERRPPRHVPERAVRPVEPGVLGGRVGLFV